MKSVFCKTYVICLPKWWVVLILIALLLCASFAFIKNIGHYLAVTKPEQSPYLVVEGWQDEYSLKEALIRFESGGYKILITTGGPIKGWRHSTYKNYADYSADLLVSNGLDEGKLVSVPTPASAQNRTFLSAVMVRKWFDKKGILVSSVDVFTESVHARRTRKLYELAFYNSVDIGIYASSPQTYNLSSWWNTSEGAKSVITEIIGFFWVTCCFSPGDYGSHQEMWGLYSNKS